jgi:hypothetical protein
MILCLIANTQKHLILKILSIILIKSKNNIKSITSPLNTPGKNMHSKKHISEKNPNLNIPGLLFSKNKLLIKVPSYKE